MERIYEDSLLFDFYGELLTERRKRIFEEVVMDDCSLSEVAEEEGITRQGVHDMVHRTREALLAYEGKLGLVRKFLSIRDRAEAIRSASDQEEVRRLAGEIIEEL